VIPEPAQWAGPGEHDGCSQRMRTKNRALSRLAAYGPGPERRRWPWIVVPIIVLVLLAGGLGWYATEQGATRSTSVPAHRGGAATGFAVAATVPANGATGIASDTTIRITFTRPLAATTRVTPTLSPPVAGSWRQAGPTTLEFDPSAPFVPSTAETLTVPAGVLDASGAPLPTPATDSFTIAPGGEVRLQQLLALTGYIPLTFTPSGPAPPANQAAMPQEGTFTWRWPTLPASLTSLWVEGQASAITKGAVMMLEDQNHIAVDASAGPQVWSILLNDLAKGATNQAPYTYVYVSKVLPETLTMWVNGVPQFPNIPVNTGVPGADTTDGTYEVFEHVTASEMKGTNPDGTTYDDPAVPWASFFNGGDALHGMPRATYGTPQSNGCVEIDVAEAGAMWPLTPIGTLVTVDGPTVS
jgi:lipoprotein-anchoring transpeptidase ErfK/SrfK